MKPTDRRDANTQREPLHIEVLAGARALETALDTTPPIPTSPWEDCEACHRKLKMANPILDRLPAYRSGSEVDRLERIFDSLERGNNV